MYILFNSLWWWLSDQYAGSSLFTFDCKFIIFDANLCELITCCIVYSYWILNKLTDVKINICKPVLNPLTNAHIQLKWLWWKRWWIRGLEVIRQFEIANAVIITISCVVTSYVDNPDHPNMASDQFMMDYCLTRRGKFNIEKPSSVL